MWPKLVALSLSLALAAPVVVDAAQVTSLIGDKDVFGLGLHPDEVASPGTSWEGYDGPGDGDGTDRWFFGPQSFVFNYTAPADPVNAARLEVLSWGQGYDPRNWDVGAPTRVYLNNVFIGNLTIGDMMTPDGNNIVRKDIFDLGAYLGILTGRDTVRFQTYSTDDGWALDYTELTLQTRAIPEPSTRALFVAALAGAGILRIQRTSKTRRVAG